MRSTPDSGSFKAADLLHEARTHEQAGRAVEAVAAYRRAVVEAGKSNAWAVEAEALRRMAVVHHHRGEFALAVAACARSLEIARLYADDGLAAEALNVQALFALDHGELEQARMAFSQALHAAGHRPELRARIEGNLGVLANVQGDLEAALAHYIRSLDAYQRAGDDAGRARTYHNLGMISADRRSWSEADEYFEQAHAIAAALGDVHLQALCLLNHAEVHIALGRFDLAKAGAEAALTIFDQLGAQIDKADAYRVIGVVYRETGQPALAESRLTMALGHAEATHAVLSEAEAARELALLHQAMGRNQDALRFLIRAHSLFGRLNARVDLVDVDRNVAELESTFMGVVRDWGQSIESADSYTHGHCERVARYAEQIARALGLEEQELTTIRLGAFLHDVGKIRVPHEVLNKPGRLNREEFELVTMHPIWGVELLEAVEFPWDIKPIIRWHHEKYDGTGYPDRLRGDEIPLPAMIIGIADVFDALTTTRSYRPQLSREAALQEMERSRAWWRADVYEAFCRAVGAAGSSQAA